VRYDYEELARIHSVVLLTTLFAWILLIAGPPSVAVFAHCPAGGVGAVPPSASLKMLRAMNSPAAAMLGWLAMLTAMMLPALVSPIYHIYTSSFTRRRFRSITLFFVGYGAIWMVVGILLVAIDLVIQLSVPHLYVLFLPAMGALFAAIVWQCSPLKQRTLNRCHSHEELAAFGFAADRDALGFGVRHGIWCAGSCWALMLFPMVLPRGHVIAMAAMAILIFGERLEQPRPPCWRRRGLGKAIRIVVAQARIRLHTCRLASATISSGT